MELGSNEAATDCASSIFESMGAGPKLRPYVGASFPARRADKAWLYVGYPLIGGHRERVTAAGVHAIDTRTPVGPLAERISPKVIFPKRETSPKVDPRPAGMDLSS
jgi:hypothetical protein